MLNNSLPLDDVNFIKYSKELADKLAESHFRIKIPGGYCLIGEGKTDNNEYFFFIIKAELQEVFTIEGVTLNLIKNVFLSPAKDFYKIGFFIERDNSFTPFMYDDLFSPQKRDLTEYFYGKFLGLTTDKNDSLTSKNFHSDTKDFIDKNVPNMKDKIGLLNALKTLYREDASGLISPKNFSESYFEGELKIKFDKMINSKFPISFTKSIRLIEKRLELKRISIPLTYALSIIGDSDSFESLEIIDSPDKGTMKKIEPQINSGTLRKVILVKEVKSNNSAT